MHQDHLSLLPIGGGLAQRRLFWSRKPRCGYFGPLVRTARVHMCPIARSN